MQVLGGYNLLRLQPIGLKIDQGQKTTRLVSLGGFYHKHLSAFLKEIKIEQNKAFDVTTKNCRNSNYFLNGNGKSMIFALSQKPNL